MEFMYGQTGRQLLLYSGFKYYREFRTNHGFKWRCVSRSCKAKIYLNENGTDILKLDTRHNHKPPENISRQVVSNSVKRLVFENPLDEPRKLIHREVTTVAKHHAENISKADVEYMRKNINRVRRKLIPKFIAGIHGISSETVASEEGELGPSEGGLPTSSCPAIRKISFVVVRSPSQHNNLQELKNARIIKRQTLQISASPPPAKRKVEDKEFSPAVKTLQPAISDVDEGPTYVPVCISEECDAMSTLWATKMRKLIEDQRVLAENLITQVLTKAYFGDLTRRTVILDTVPSKTETNLPRAYIGVE